MANLITKELAGLEDQLNFEHMMCAKYKAAASETADAKLKASYKKYETQHKQNFNTLLGYLR